MKIAGKTIGGGHVFIVAELSANHNADINIAKETIKMAKSAGADAVKLQTYTPDTITIDCANEYFQINQGTIWDGTTLYELYKTAYTPYEWHKELFVCAENEGIPIFSAPFDRTAVDLLESLDTPAYKIASLEITDIPLIEYVASKGRPIIISTGIARCDEIKEAVDTCIACGNSDIALLKCTSAYPTPAGDVNLKTMCDMRERFGFSVGLSDHTLGNAVSLAAVAMGASIIERHVILDKAIGGPDASFSLDEAEFRALVSDIRTVESAIGKATYELTDKQLASRQHSRSLFVVRDIACGEVITEENVRSIRPAFGMHTRYYKDILGQRVNRDLAKGTPMNRGYVEFNQ